MVIRRFLISGLILFVSGPAFAGPASLTHCIENIKQVCAGLEERLETCMSERSQQLSEECRDLLQNAYSFSKTQQTNACIEDIKRSCPGLEAQALSECIAQNKARFAESCRASLDTLAVPDSGPTGR
jgi:hypothetical protein